MGVLEKMRAKKKKKKDKGRTLDILDILRRGPVNKAQRAVPFFLSIHKHEALKRARTLGKVNPRRFRECI